MQQFFLYSKIVVLSLSCISASAATSPSLLRYIVGSKLATESIQKVAQEADTVTGFETPVLQMNSLGKLFGYTTFNWFNTTWVDEKAVHDESPTTLKWQLIHEKWHTLAKHDLRRFLGIGMLLSPYTQVAT